MSLVNGLHGVSAAMLLCALLFVDEAGVPLPIAPNEALLIVAGLLIATGAMSPWLFFPAATLAMTAGMMTGYGWARAVGPTGLRSLAARLHGERAYDRAQERIRAATPRGIAVCRILPGVRTYATLIAGAAEVDVRTFLAGALPALLVWEAAFTLLGVLVGYPVELLASRVQALAFSGALLVLLAAGSWYAMRHLPHAEHGGAITVMPTRERMFIAIAIDVGVVTCLVAGIDRITREVMHSVHPDGRNDLLVLIGAVILGYLAAARRGAGATVGERVLEVTYHRLPSARQLWRRSRRRVMALRRRRAAARSA